MNVGVHSGDTEASEKIIKTATIDWGRQVGVVVIEVAAKRFFGDCAFSAPLR
jgi:hypothetical protein